MKKITILALAILLTVTNVTFAQGSSEKSSSTGAIAESKGDVVLSLAFNVEDTEDEFTSQVKPILDAFKELHPEIKDINYVNASKRAEDQTVTMMSSGKFEDLMLAPLSVSIKEYPNYFAPLGDSQELNDKYFYGDFIAVEGKTYGMPIGVVYEGLLYNQQVLDEYNNGNVPKTLEELESLCEVLTDNGIISFYTNAGAKWPLRFWDNLAVTQSEDPTYANSIVTNKAPWSFGEPLYDVMTFLGDLAEKGSIEPDTVTEQWDKSRVSLATGKTAFMLIGSWALPQVKKIAEEMGKSADDIGFAPFPYKNNVSSTNKLNVRVSEDLFLVVNKNSENLELAVEFAKYYCERISIPRGMNSILRDGGEVVQELQSLSDLDYVDFYSVPSKDLKISEMCSNSQIDVHSQGSYIIPYVIEPSIQGNGPNFDALNAEWAKNFK